MTETKRITKSLKMETGYHWRSPTEETQRNYVGLSESLDGTKNHSLKL